MADLPFSGAVHDELISDDLAEPHRGGFPATASYYIRALDLFRTNQDRARVAAE